ncbi:MAG: hypothetical protein V6Z89_15265 [Desulfobacter sp.]
MNQRELKNHLFQIARQHGEKALTPDEVDYMRGRISYNTYQNRCYAQYLREKQPRQNNPK